jgi:hypothetical protein
MGIANEEDAKAIKNHQDSVEVMEMKVAKFSRGKAANLAVGLLISYKCNHGYLALIAIDILVLLEWLCRICVIRN